MLCYEPVNLSNMVRYIINTETDEVLGLRPCEVFRLFRSMTHIGVAHGAQGFALVLLLTQRIPLVEFTFASGQRDFVHS